MQQNLNDLWEFICENLLAILQTRLDKILDKILRRIRRDYPRFFMQNFSNVEPFLTVP